MLKKNIFPALLFFLSIVLSCSLSAETISDKGNNRNFRVGYYEGGPYSDYTNTMRTLIDGLIELGWISDTNKPEFHHEMVKPYWDWLSQLNSSQLSFRPEDSYSANWDNKQRARIKKELLSKLKSNSLDLVIAMGTWAGQDLANNEHSVPVLVLSTSNPIEAGIIKASDNSGYSHVTARVDPNRYLRQIRMFHRITEFSTLGVAYEDSPDGHIYSAVNEIKQIAKERGFTPVFCQVNDTTTDIAASDTSCMECYRKLAEQVDAVYVTALTCVDRRNKDIAETFRKTHTPSFAMIGSKFVEGGLMMSISSDSGYRTLGSYNAMKFTKILTGTTPGTLPQIFNDPLDIAVNIETIKQIGFKMPASILKIAAEKFEN